MIWPMVEINIGDVKLYFQIKQGLYSSERESDTEGILMGKKNGEETPTSQKVDDPLEYLAEEVVVGGPNVEKQLKKQPENIGILSI